MGRDSQDGPAQPDYSANPGIARSEILGERISDLAGGQISPAEISEAATQILRSSSFSGSERMRQLFSYIIARFLEDDRGGLKETAIGAAVFGRNPD